MDKNIKIYKVTFWRHLLIGFDFIQMGLFISIFIFAIVMSILQGQYLLGACCCIPIFGLFYIMITPFYLHKQYTEIEKNRVIEYNTEELTITICDNNLTIKIYKKDIEKIIVNKYDSINYSAKLPNVNYEFFTLVLNNGKSITITSLIAKFKKFKDISKEVLSEEIYLKENFVY